MAADVLFPHTPTPGKLEDFLKRLQSMGVPGKIDQQYLGAVGFGSSNSRPFIPIMKKVGLLDGAGKPTELYTKGLRGGESGRALLAAGIRAGYDNVFQTYSDAQIRSDAELATFFKSHSDLDVKKVGLAVKTFKAVCKFGDFAASATATATGQVSDVGEGEGDDPPDPNTNRQRRQQNGGGSPGVTINVNIALSVDATSDAAVYDAFFAAMAKHLGGLMDGA